MIVICDHRMRPAARPATNGIIPCATSGGVLQLTSCSAKMFPTGSPTKIFQGLTF